MTSSKRSKNIYNKHIQSGFTLIEILVATVILFTSIATVSVIYKGAYLSAEKANAHVTISGVIPMVLNNIRQDIRAQGNSELTELSGKELAWGVNYNWSAAQIAFKAPPDVYDPDNGNMLSSPNKYKLWQVDLIVSYKVARKSYQYNELSWNDK